MNDMRRIEFVMRNRNTIRLLCLAIALAFGWRAFDEPSSNASGVYGRQAPVDFERDIRPLLHARCVGCHGVNKQQSGLRLDHKAGAMKGGVSGAVIVPGGGANSELIRRVSSADESEMMPPTGGRLTPREIALLKAWIDAGAPWPEEKIAVEAKRADQNWWSL